MIGRVTNLGPPQFIITGRQGDQLVQLGADDLMVTDLSFGRHCVDLDSVADGGIPLHVQIALDVSGSMEAVRGDIAASLRSFLSLVPTGAQCQLQLFDHQRYFLSAPAEHGAGLTVGTSAAPPASCQQFVDDRVTAAINTVGGGGTDIVHALKPLYQEMISRRDVSNLLLVISDGAGSDSRSSSGFRALKQLRDTAVETANGYTILKFLGSYSTNYPLNDLADHSLAGMSPAQDFDQSIFAKAAHLIEHQFVLTANSCS